MTAASQTASADLTGIADYAFTSPLGYGTNSQYFLAVAPERLGIGDEQVVVKVLTAQPSDALEDLARELKVFAAVQSPYLTALYDAGQQGDTCYVAMEHHPLGSLANPARELSRADIIAAVRDAARGAHDLHEAGIVHRDIQPSNILLDEGGAKLSDFDLAQILQPGLTVSGSTQIQAAEYMDPAMILGETPSRASDIWSLGATLHRAATGVSIWGEVPTDPQLAVRFVLHGQPRLHDSLDADLALALKPCLAADPADRYHTAAELAEQLDGL
jgi:serine/threonine protein kinase